MASVRTAEGREVFIRNDFMAEYTRSRSQVEAFDGAVNDGDDIRAREYAGVLEVLFGNMHRLLDERVQRNCQ